MGIFFVACLRIYPSINKINQNINEVNIFDENQEWRKFHIDSLKYVYGKTQNFLKYKDENDIKLSPKENELLKLLLNHLNDLMPRELALIKIWNDDNYFTSRSMDVYIAKIRKYLQKDNRLEIENIHGKGFRLIERK